MTMLRSHLENFLREKITLEDLFAELRPYYHSLNSEHREDVVDLLVELPEAEASRELLLLYRLSLWRTTRLKIVRALSRVPSPRALEFLMRMALNEGDIVLCEEAIWALGRSRKGVAARFLCHLFEACSQVIRPKVVAAIGESLDITLVSSFQKMLFAIENPQHSLLARNLALALAQLKCPTVLPWLEKMMLESSDVAGVQGALLAYGKIARDASFCERNETMLQKDMQLWQLAQTVLAHIQFRNQWKLEDYLQKLFEAEKIHSALPLELNGFSESDVYEGLKIFASESNVSRLATALASISFERVPFWYAEFFDVNTLHPDSLVSVLRSVSRHVSAEFKSMLEMVLLRIVRERLAVDVLEAWAEAVVLALPKPEDLIQDVVLNDTFLDWPDTHKVALLNALTTHGLVIQKDVKRKRAVVKLIESLLFKKLSNAVVARALRALGQLEEVGNKTHEAMRKFVAVEELLSSCLFVVEKVPSLQSSAVLAQAMELNSNADVKLRTMFLKAGAPQQELVSDALVALVDNCMRSKNEALATEALLCAAAHPKALFVSGVRLALENAALRLPAVLAAKALGSEELLDSLGSCLRAPSESVVGRTVDALVAFSSARAKRMVLDYMCANPLNIDVCEKVIRTLDAPARAGDFFAGKIGDVLRDYPAHPLREGLFGLRERLSQGKSYSIEMQVGLGDMQELDKEIESRISGYMGFDNDVKSALRAAEMPFFRPEMFTGAIDKSSSVIAWCKAIDLAMERHLGRKMLFPKLENSLHEFQNVVHMLGLNDSQVSYSRLKQALKLDGVLGDEHFPAHKMTLVAQGILSGRIVQDHWRILDGLRAWAVVMLLFMRGEHMPNGKPLLSHGALSQKGLIDFVKRLVTLQDVRNQAAHRETLLQFPQIDELRGEVSAAFREWGLLSKA